MVVNENHEIGRSLKSTVTYAAGFMVSLLRTMNTLAHVAE